MQLIPAYLPSVNYMAQLTKSSCLLTTQGNYQKQTYRNRCVIYGANGKLNLTIPIHHSKSNHRQKDSEVNIKWVENWQKKHWKSIESAYRSSPFFEFYEDDIKPVFFCQPDRLMDYNCALMKCLCDMLEIDYPNQSATTYLPLNSEEELLILAKNNPITPYPRYAQVFENNHGFISNLSVIDLLFNLGPESRSYLEELTDSQEDINKPSY